MPATMSSRQRMLAALRRQEPDHVPCSFMIFGAVRPLSRDYAETIECQVAMGLDTFVQIPIRPPLWENDYRSLYGMPVSYDPSVRVKEWVERPHGERWPILIKEYHTPAGILRAEVRQTDDWPLGNHIPFLDDYVTPRSRKFIIESDRDVDALRYLLVAPKPAEIAAFQIEAEQAKAQARRHDLLVAGGWGVGADLMGWVYGLQNMIYAVYDRPALMHHMLDLIAGWNQRRMQVVMDAGIDLYIYRAWYENCDFFSPYTWREFVYPHLKEGVDLAHERGILFGYLITASCMPLLDMIAEAGVDVIIGVDPSEWDMAAVKRKLAGKVCLWGGVNGHLTVEQGTEEAVRQEVRRAISVLAPSGGFILSPVDNVREDAPLSRRNVNALIDEWQKLT